MRVLSPSLLTTKNFPQCLKEGFFLTPYVLISICPSFPCNSLFSMLKMHSDAARSVSGFYHPDFIIWIYRLDFIISILLSGFYRLDFIIPFKDILPQKITMEEYWNSSSNPDKKDWQDGTFWPSSFVSNSCHEEHKGFTKHLLLSGFGQFLFWFWTERHNLMQEFYFNYLCLKTC